MIRAVRARCCEEPLRQHRGSLDSNSGNAAGKRLQVKSLADTLHRCDLLSLAFSKLPPP